MARNRRSNRTVNSNYATRKDDRDYVAIVAKNKMVGIWTGNEETSKYIMAPNDRDTRLGALQLFSEILDKIPTNDELLDKQVAIYALNCVTDCFTRPGDIIRSKEVSQEAKDMMAELMVKYNERNFNCFLVPEKNSNATIVAEGFEWLQELGERLIAEANGVTYSKVAVKEETTAVAHKTPLQKLEDKLSELQELLIDAEDDDEIAKLESKIARTEAMIEKEMAKASARTQA